MHSNGDVYVGQHKNLIKNGLGQYFYKSSGMKYVGQWLNNLKHGEGELIIQKDQNERLKGTFDNNEFVFGHYTDPQGNIFKSLKHPDET